MLAETINYQPASIWTVAIALIGLATFIVQQWFIRNAKTANTEAKESAAAAKAAAESTAAQLRNNGGSSALDKIEAGQRAIIAHLGKQDERLATLERHVIRSLNPSVPLPPPEVPKGPDLS